jgi:hypothetical protein
MNPDLFFGLEMLQHEQQVRPRERKVYKPRTDPRLVMNDGDFKRHFRFSKESATKLTEMLHDDLNYENNRGLPLSPIQQVCLALNNFAGNSFQRISAWCGEVSQPTARSCVKRVTEALVRRKPLFISMPDNDEMEDTAERMLEKFKLPRFSFAVDGCQIRFSEAPRRIPENKTTQQFWSRKQCYSINAQVVGNDMFIYDIDVSWPGSTHDARVWNRSSAKRVIEEQKRFLIAGDTGYPISENLIKPYSQTEAGADRRKRLFNRRLSGLRTVMSECLYGVWKRRFPVLKNLRTDFELSQKTIVATAVLFNIARKWGDDGPEDETDLEDPDEDEDLGFVVQEGNAASVRLRGQVERDRLKDRMPVG